LALEDFAMSRSILTFSRLPVIRPEISSAAIWARPPNTPLLSLADEINTTTPATTAAIAVRRHRVMRRFNRRRSVMALASSVMCWLSSPNRRFKMSGAVPAGFAEA